MAEEPQANSTREQSLPFALERDLRCGICTDVLYKCLTLVPCGHNFCAACLARWRRSAPSCPECRVSVRQAVRNVAADCMVETFIRAHPSAARSPQELRAMDMAERGRENQAVLRWLLRDPDADANRCFVESARPNAAVHAVPTPNRQRYSNPQSQLPASRGSGAGAMTPPPSPRQLRQSRHTQSHVDAPVVSSGSAACVV